MCNRKRRERTRGGDAGVGSLVDVLRGDREARRGKLTKGSVGSLEVDTGHGDAQPPSQTSEFESHQLLRLALVLLENPKELELLPELLLKLKDLRISCSGVTN